jgi:hypothetical protein
MDLETIVMDKETAKEKWQEAIVAEKNERKSAARKALHDMRRAFYYLKKGHKILDLFETLKIVGLNADGDPKVAIVETKASTCQFHRENPGRGQYMPPGLGWRQQTEHNGLIIVPENTFPVWPGNKIGWQSRDITSPAPAIPPKYQTTAEHLYLLWEVEHWQPIAARDPLLLRRISRNLFVIYGHWNTTKLERAIIRGRL